MTSLAYDPLAQVLVSDERIRARQREINEYPIYLGDYGDPIYGIEANSGYLSELKTIVDAWATLGLSTYAVNDLAGNVYHLNESDLFNFWETLVQLKARRAARLLTYASTLIAQNAATSDVTERDVHDSSWPVWDSNVIFPDGTVFDYAELDSANKHADITISGTYSTVASVASGTNWRTVRANQPIYRSSYWEFDITGNSGDLYIGLINDTPDLSADYKLGEDAHSVGVLITDEVIKEALYNNVVSGLTDYDCATATASRPSYPGIQDVADRVALRYDPYSGLLEVCWGRDQDDYQTVKSLCHTDIATTGYIYPALSIKSSTNAITGHFGAAGNDLDNYDAPYAPWNFIANFGKGLFVVDESGT